MERVYLKNGQECILKEKLGERFLVNKVYTYEVYNHEDSYTEDSIDDMDILVDEIFYNKPTEKISSEILRLKQDKISLEKEVSELVFERNRIKQDINTLTKTQIANDKLIINKNELINAKKLVLFKKDEIMPLTMTNDSKSFRGLRLTMEVKLIEGEERFWGAKLYYDSDYSSTFLCPKYGVLIDPTNEEVEETIKKRVRELEFSDYWLKKTDNKYLTPQLILDKNNYILEDNKKTKLKLEEEFEQLKEKLKKYKEI